MEHNNYMADMNFNHEGFDVPYHSGLQQREPMNKSEAYKVSRLQWTMVWVMPHSIKNWTMKIIVNGLSVAFIFVS